MKSVIIVSYSVIAALIGAGFASGQEILCYFASFGRFGILGLLLFSFLLSSFAYTILRHCIAEKTYTYDSFLQIFTSKRSRLITKAVTLAFSVAVYGAMLSACGELFFSITGIAPHITAFIFAIASTAVLSIGSDNLFTLNAALGVCLVMLIVFSSIYMLSYREYHAFSPQISTAVESGAVYAGYNLVSLVPVLAVLSRRLHSKTDAAASAAIIGFASFFVMLLIYLLLSIYYGKITLGELPMLTLAMRQGPFFAALYSFILLCAIITTLLSSGSSCCEILRIQKNPIFISLLSAAAYTFSGMGFSRLINTAYRFCGIIGFFVCTATIYSCVKTHKQ